MAPPAHIKNRRELCMALTVASRHYVPNAPVRLHKRHLCSILNSQISILSCKSKKHNESTMAKNRLTSDRLMSDVSISMRRAPSSRLQAPGSRLQAPGYLAPEKKAEHSLFPLPSSLTKKSCETKHSQLFSSLIIISSETSRRAAGLRWPLSRLVARLLFCFYRRRSQVSFH